MAKVKSNGMNFEIKGGKELEQTLLDLAKEYGPRNIRNALNTPLKNALKPVEEQIRTNTPVDTGGLRNSVKSAVGRGKQARGFGGKSRGFKTGGPGSNVIAAARTGWMKVNFRHAVAVEYGSRETPATRVIRDALKDNSDSILGDLFKRVGANIEKTVGRLNKKKKLGKLRIR